MDCYAPSFQSSQMRADLVMSRSLYSSSSLRLPRADLRVQSRLEEDVTP